MILFFIDFLNCCYVVSESDHEIRSGHELLTFSVMKLKSAALDHSESGVDSMEVIIDAGVAELILNIIPLCKLITCFRKVDRWRL